ncbi:polymer-forming cytoskeletal protein [Acidovorax sp. Root70]|uniref:polymer-forming cytoskeletal protein n=1 Tax=Acidovorax sp. Root70 TaxID=1736590 RepID=UPI000B2A08FD|nr:polymer-forming cytoskeletal protein [Acidovorax sp. Root70]
MPTARLCPLADVAHRLPPAGWMAERLAQDPAALANETALWVTGDVQWPALHLDAPLAPGSPLRSWLQDLADGFGADSLPSAPFLILVDGDLRIDGALTSADTDGTTHLVVAGNAHLRNAVVGGQLVCVQGTLRVDELLWGHHNHGELRVQGGLQAHVALFTDEYHLHIKGPEQVELLLDEVRNVPHLAEFSSEIVGAVFPPEFYDGVDAGEGGLAAMLNRNQVLAAVRAGHSAVRTSAGIDADQPMAHDLCADNAISIENIRAVVHTPVIAHKEHKASGWFQQTDFSLCQRHVDEEGDARDDNVFITVWKAWDFYLSVEQVPAPRNWLERLATKVWRSAVPTAAQRTLLYRRYTQGEPGPWQVLAPPPDAGSAPEAWKACEHAWRGVLDYVRKAVGQHRARYPLYQRLQATLTAEHIEAFTSLPVFAEQYNDWWDSDRNGYWEDEVWVGARQPCMHNGVPWGRVLKYSWRNGDDAPGDDEDNAHSAYQIDVDEAREGPAVVEFSYTQRQSDIRAPLPRCAADHVARLLRFHGLVQARIRAQHDKAQAEVRGSEAAAQRPATPPPAAGLPDAGGVEGR